MLRNPFYCGIIFVRKTGQSYKGAHEPIIAVELFKRVQSIKSGRFTKKSTRHNHLYRGLLRCECCGRSLYGELQKGRVYYRCQTKDCDTKSKREDQIDRIVIGLLTELRMTENDWVFVEQRLPSLIGAETVEAKQQGLKLRLSQIESRLSKLTDMLLDDLIDADAFREKKQALLLEQSTLSDELANSDKECLSPNNVRKFLELANNLANLYASAAKEQKRRIAEWAVSNFRASEKSLYVEASNWLRGTQNMQSVLCCADDRDNSRTFDPDILRSICYLDSIDFSVSNSIMRIMK